MISRQADLNTVALLAAVACCFSANAGSELYTLRGGKQKLIDRITFDIPPNPSPDKLQALLTAFESYGLAVINADISNRGEMVREASSLTEKAIENLTSIVGEEICYKDVPLSPYEKDWQLTDFAMRCYKRFDLRVVSNSVLRSFADNPTVRAVARTLLGTDDMRVIDLGFVVACPGANTQHWHKDDGMTPGVRKAVGFFYPLVAKPDERFGSAEFQAGSQYSVAEVTDLDMHVKPPLLNGEILVYDYLTIHRGSPNTHSEPRPMLWLVIGGPEYYADLSNWAQPGCEMGTKCGTETIREEWGLDEWGLNGERHGPEF